MEGPFRRPIPDGLKLIETFRRDGRVCVRLNFHFARLERTAAALGVPFDAGAVGAAVATVRGAGPLRVRLTLDLRGKVAVEAAPLGPPPAVWRLTLAEERLDRGDPWLRLKTSERAAHDRARAALPPGIDEAILLNREGEVCEGTITSVFVERDGELLTPPLEAGLLPGVLRGVLLAEGRARETVLGPDDLRSGRLFVGNSLRGLIPARLTSSSRRG